MKYVIFKKDIVVMPVMFHEHLNHSDIKIPGWTPVSAGSVYNNNNGLLKVDYNSKSVSLGLHALKTDGAVLNACIKGFNVSLFIDYNNLFYKKV